MVTGSAQPLFTVLRSPRAPWRGDIGGDARKMLPATRLQLHAAAVRLENGHHRSSRAPVFDASDARDRYSRERRWNRDRSWRGKQEFIVFATIQCRPQCNGGSQFACEWMNRQRGLLDLSADARCSAEV